MLGRRALALAAVTVVAGLLGPVVPAGAAPTDRTPGITVTELPTLGGERSRPADINDRGQIAGESTTATGDTHAVLWDGGVPVDLTPGLTGPATATGQYVNNRGLVAGTVRSVLLGQVTVWEDGEATDVAALSLPMALNDRGQLVFLTAGPWLAPDSTTVWHDGESTVAPHLPDGAPTLGLDISAGGVVVGLAGFGPSYLWTWRPGRAPEALPNPEGGLATLPLGINDSDVVAGVVSYGTPERGSGVVRWVDGVPTDIGTLGGRSSFAQDTTNTALRPINAWGDIVGTSETPAGEAHAFLWRNGHMTDLGTLGGPFAFAEGVNDVGQVVGVSALADGSQHPFVWQDGHMLDLTTVPGLEHLTEVTDINNRGEIVGVVDTVESEPRAVLVRVPPQAPRT